MPRKKLDRNVSKARKLRRDMSLPEVLLWNLLRRSPDGVHFRRQHSIGDYVLDFYCANSRVAFEVDGVAHDMGDRPEHDAKRDAWLREQAIEVVRIPASEVLRSVEDAAESMVRYCQP